MSLPAYHEMARLGDEIRELRNAKLTTARDIIDNARFAADTHRLPEAIEMAREIVRSKDATRDQIAAACEVLGQSTNADDNRIAAQRTEQLWPAQCSPDMWADFHKPRGIGLRYLVGWVIVALAIGWWFVAMFTAVAAVQLGAI